MADGSTAGAPGKRPTALQFRLTCLQSLLSPVKQKISWRPICLRATLRSQALRSPGVHISWCPMLAGHLQERLPADRTLPFCRKSIQAIPVMALSQRSDFQPPAWRWSGHVGGRRRTYVTERNASVAYIFCRHPNSCETPFPAARVHGASVLLNGCAEARQERHVHFLAHLPVQDVQSWGMPWL